MAGATRDFFTIEILEFEEIHRLPGQWSAARLRALLDHLDYDDIDGITDPDLEEMATMATQDLALRSGTDRVLEFVFGTDLTPGARQEIAHDLTQDRPWEQHSVLGRQAQLFAVVGLLQKAFPSEYGIPDAARVRARIVASGKETTSSMREAPSPSLVIRWLADSMPEDAVLRRLYREALETGPFPEASEIIWDLHVTADEIGKEPAQCEIEVHSSLQWLGPLAESSGTHTSHAHSDP